jgi:hypothetical protein
LFLVAGILVVVLTAGGFWIVRTVLHPRVETLDPDEPVVVAGPGMHMEIEVMRAKLDALGIPAYARNRQGPFMPGGVPPQLWGWEVLVRRQDVGDAEGALFGVYGDADIAGEELMPDADATDD